MIFTTSLGGRRIAFILQTLAHFLIEGLLRLYKVPSKKS
jgi:hypothetical protein